MLLVSILNFVQDSVSLCNEYKMMREIIVVSQLCQLLLYGFDFINENFVLIYSSDDLLPFTMDTFKHAVYM